MKRVFIFIFTFLLCFGLLRSCLGQEPLTFSAFMRALSKLDFDFSNTKAFIAYMKDLTFSFEVNGILDLLMIVVNFLKALVSPIIFIVTVIADIGSLLYSAVSVLLELIGFDIFGSEFGNFAGGGHGGGGGGIR